MYYYQRSQDIAKIIGIVKITIIIIRMAAAVTTVYFAIVFVEA